MSVIHCILSFLTLPGTYARAFLEHVLLKVMRIHVEDAAYLQRNELCGHIEHKPVHSVGKGLVLCIVPLLVLSAVSVPMLWAALLFLREWGVTPRSIETGGVSALFWVCIVFLYFVFSLLCSVFPGYEDTLFLCEAWREKKIVPRILLLLPVWCLRAGALLSRFGVWHILIAAAIVYSIVF